MADNRMPRTALRDERQFRVAITFANLGAFGNLKKQERMS